MTTLTMANLPLSVSDVSPIVWKGLTSYKHSSELPGIVENKEGDPKMHISNLKAVRERRVIDNSTVKSTGEGRN